MWIVMEGVDGSGKDTQIGLLRKKMKFAYFKYPTPQNQKIQEYLARKLSIEGSDLVDLFLDDIYAEQEKLAGAAKKGLAIVDRYVFSTIAYEAHLVEEEEIQRRIERRGFIRPDKVLLLDLPAKTAYERKKGQKTLDRYEEDVAYLERVRQNFLELYQERYGAKKWVKIDASRSVEEVHAAILKEIR